MHLVLTGATGLIGSVALDILLKDPQVTKITILSRSPVPQAWSHAKAEAIYVKDFSSYSPELLKRLEDAHGCIWALGETRRPGIDTDALERINIVYPTTAAKAFTKGKELFTFVFVSIHGIEQSTFEDMVHKGEAEKALLAFGKEEPAFKFYSLRLCAMDYRAHKAIHPYVKYPQPWYKVVASWVIPIIKYWYPTLNCDSTDFATLMAELAKSDGAPIDSVNTIEDGRILGALGFNDVVKKFKAQKGFVED